MNRRRRESLSSFVRDRRGNFAVITALTMMPVLLFIGAAVDMSLFYRGKTIVQSATDAAALAAAKQFFVESDPARLEAYARDFFEANTAALVRTDATMTYEGTDWTADRQRELKIRSCFEYRPIFLTMLHVQFDGLAGKKCAETESVIVVGNTTVEVAMVLDTSGSMNDSPAAGGATKIATLRTQAAKAVETLFGSGGSVGGEDPVRIGVVPFSGGVNIGATGDEWWMDVKGQSVIHHENFDWSTVKVGGISQIVGSLLYPGAYVGVLSPTSFYTRQSIYKTLKAKNPKWAYRGCVEARPNTAVASYGLTDAPPNLQAPDSLFVPYFAPDEADFAELGSYSWTNSFLQDSTSVRSPADPSAATKRMKDMNKYLSPTEDPNVRGTVGANQHWSPSWMCDSDPVQPLTAGKADVLKKVASLTATGSTNVAQGVEWGWKVLSKTMPFDQGRASGDNKNVKAMIVMTDGAHTYYNDTGNGSKNPAVSAYGAYGFTGYNTKLATTPRLFDYKSGISTAKTAANYTTAMDGRLAAICENAKNDGRVRLETARGDPLVDERGAVTRDGIIVYTIAFDIPVADQPRVNALLSGCSSYKLGDLRETTKPYAKKAKYFYSAGSAAELNAAFSDIAASLSNLRIAR